jgi:hypothetical protein
MVTGTRFYITLYAHGLSCLISNYKVHTLNTRIHKEKIQRDATMYQNFIIPYLYEAQHVSDDTPPINRGLKLHWQPLVFHRWKVVERVVGGQRLPTTRPTTFHVWKTRGCQCSFRLLIMGGVSPETCWASYKYGIIKFWYIVASCWIFHVNCTMMHGTTNISVVWNMAIRKAV